MKRKIVVTDYDGSEYEFQEFRLLDAASFVMHCMEECCSLEGVKKQIKVKIVDGEED